MIDGCINVIGKLYIQIRLYMHLHGTGAALVSVLCTQISMNSVRVCGKGLIAINLRTRQFVRGVLYQYKLII